MPDSAQIEAIGGRNYIDEANREIDEILAEVLEDRARSGLELPEGEIERIRRAVAERMRRRGPTKKLYWNGYQHGRVYGCEDQKDIPTRPHRITQELLKQSGEK